MATPDALAPEPAYLAIALAKQKQQQDLIPTSWRLPPHLLPPPNGPSPKTSFLNVPASCGLLSARELQITGTYDATALASGIRDRKWSSEEVVTAFCKRAAIAQQLANCLTEIMFDSALQRARFLDAEMARTGTVVGPLHGVPTSLKDTFRVRGYDSSIGIAALAGKPVTPGGGKGEESDLVRILRDAGAVLYCKTNVPQTLQSLDSHNFLFGRTLNPRNTSLTPGGSSGGEGALMALRGSVLGVGTDVGGSVRVPAMCNGLYGIKPSHGRVPFRGQQGASGEGSGSVSLQASAGPIATSLRDCELFLRVVGGAGAWRGDPDVVVGGWETWGGAPSMAMSVAGGKRKSRFGLLRTDGNVTPLPPVDRALSDTKAALLAAGAEVYEIQVPSFKECQSLANKFFSMDGANATLDLLAKTGEPLTPWLAGRLKRRPAASYEAICDLHRRRTDLQARMLKEMWSDQVLGAEGAELDAIILPVAPHPVPPVERWNSTGYTASFVLLDYPAGVVPVRDITEADLQVEMEPPRGKISGWEKVNRELCEC
jgi:amidase